MSYETNINVARNEFENLKEEVQNIRSLLERTRVVLHGEHGDNGMRSSLERAHEAISNLTNTVKAVHDGVAELALLSHTGDKEMEIMVLKSLEELKRTLDERERANAAEIKREQATDRRWKIGQVVVLSLFVAGQILRYFL